MGLKNSWRISSAFPKKYNFIFLNPFVLFSATVLSPEFELLTMFFILILILLYRTLSSLMLSSTKTNHRKKESAEGEKKLLFIWQAYYALEYFPLKEKKTWELMLLRETLAAVSTSFVHWLTDSTAGVLQAGNRSSIQGLPFFPLCL